MRAVWVRNLLIREARLMRRGWLAAGALVAVLSLVALVSCADAGAYAGRVHPGVRALGIELGGQSEVEARERLAARLEGARAAVALRVDGQEVALPAGAFGDPAAHAAQLTAAALRLGRETPLAPVTGLVRSLGVPVGARAVAPPAPDERALRAALASLAAETERAGVEPYVLVDPTGPNRLTVVPGVIGRRLDVERTAADLAAAFGAAVGASEAFGSVSAGAPLAPPAPRVVEASFVPVAPAVGEAQLEAARAKIGAALAQPVAVALGARSFTLERPWQVVERVEVAPGAPSAPGRSGELVFAPVFGPAFDAWAAPVRQAAARPAADARLEVRGEEIAVAPDVPGAALDPAALRAAVAAALFGEARRVEVAPQPVAARITAAALAPVQAQAQRLVSEPLVLARGERSWSWGRAELVRLLALPAEPEAPVRLDAARLRARLEPLAKESDRPAKSPRLEVREGRIASVPGEDGEGIDLDAAVEALQAGLHAGGAARTVALPVRPVPPEVGDAKLEAARAQAERIISGPLTVRYGGNGGKSWTIPQAELPALLLFGESVNGIVPYLSRDQLVARLQPIADELNPQLEREHEAALAAWQRREEERAAVEAARVAEAARAAAGEEAADEPRRESRPDPQPKRQRVDVAATAAALWVQASGGTADGRATRTADVKLTTDDPAKALAARPATATATGTAAHAAPAKWIDVNLTTQSLVAYEGDWPVFSALVSTGLPRTPTPVGSYRIFTKLVADDMRGGSYATGDYYFLPQVPYVMYFLEGGYALHGTYWHSNFGSPMSRGCVNLTPQQAKWLFDWAPLGTVVVVHT